jgi:hypothetical protein
MPEHFEEWWGYGTFFLATAISQGAYGAALLRWSHQLLLLLGIGGNLLIVVLYLVTRTVGVPTFGPHAGEVEGVGAIDLCATVSELAIVLALRAVLLQNLSPQRRKPAPAHHSDYHFISGTPVASATPRISDTWLWFLKESRHQGWLSARGYLGVRTPAPLGGAPSIIGLFVGLRPSLLAADRPRSLMQLAIEAAEAV